jgi:branched-chain amino acid transport system substrate-binding protein
MTFQRRSLLLASLALSSTSFAKTKPSAPTPSDPWLIGQSAPMTGPAAQLGVQFRSGAQLYFDRVNTAGGVKGKPIKLLTLDDGYDPVRTKSNTEELLQQGTLLSLFGYIGTPTSLAALPLLDAGTVPFFAPFTGAGALRTPFRKHVFHVRSSYDDETSAIVKQAVTMNLKRVAIFFQNDAYGQAGLEGTRKALQAYGLLPIAIAPVERNTTDVSKAVKDLAALKPDLVVMISAYASCAAFIKEYRATGLTASFANVSFVGTQALSDALGKDAAGVWISQVMPYYNSMSYPVSQEFSKACEQSNFLVQANYSSFEGWVAAKVLVEGMRKTTGPLTPKSLMNTLDTLSYDVGGLTVSYTSSNHNGSGFVDLVMLNGTGRILR